VFRKFRIVSYFGGWCLEKFVKIEAELAAIPVLIHQSAVSIVVFHRCALQMAESFQVSAHGSWFHHYVPARGSQSSAKVHVLEIKKVIFVETTDGVQSFSPCEETGTAHPVRSEDIVQQHVETLHCRRSASLYGSGESLLKYITVKSRKAPEGQLRITSFVLHPRCNDSHLRIVPQSAEHCRDRSLQKPGVGIQHENKFLEAAPEYNVMCSAETEISA
jgi:hypothetical protein